jgi:hypothetical protein
VLDVRPVTCVESLPRTRSSWVFIAQTHRSSVVDMLDFIRRLFERSTHGVSPQANDGDTEMRSVRRHLYRKKSDLTNKPLIILSGGPIETARELIPFLRPATEMETTAVSRDETIAYNGEEADEIHMFANVTQAGSRLSRILVRDGIIIELTIQG